MEIITIAIIVYWSCQCGLQICSKLTYILYHLLGIPCVVLGFLAVWMWKDQSELPHLYSIHSWLGMVTLALAALQVGDLVAVLAHGDHGLADAGWSDQLPPPTLLSGHLLQS